MPAGLISTVVEVLGLLLLLVGGWLAAGVAGVAIAAGVVLLLLGVALGVRTDL